MPDKNEKPENNFIVASILCVACCSVPLISVFVSAATLAMIADYLEPVAVAISGLGIALIMYELVINKKPCQPHKRGCRDAKKRDTRSTSTEKKIVY